MLVREYMSTSVVTANLRDGLHQTFLRMRERGIRHLPVLGEDGRLAGILSDRDLLRPAFVDEGENTVRPFTLDNTHTVASAMTATPKTVNADDAVQVALSVFVEHKYGALPVLGEGGALVGVISQIDLLRAFQDQLSGEDQ